jgi:hypothetical protein
MKPRTRKASVTAHVAFSVGWMGADAAFLALAIVGLTSQDLQHVRAAYLSMDLIGWFVIVPFSLASLVTGLILALGTPWGLFRYYWIIAKFVLTSGAIFVLLVHTKAMQEAAMRVSGAAADTLSGAMGNLAASHAGGHLGSVQLQLVVAAGAGLLVLLTTTTLGVFKPWGRAPFCQGRILQ